MYTSNLSFLLPPFDEVLNKKEEKKELIFGHKLK